MKDQQKNKISLIDQQASEFREKIYEITSEIQKHVEKRDKLNEQAKELSQKIRELKNERNNLNDEVKTLKQQRDEMRSQIRNTIEEIKIQNQSVKDLRKGTPRKGYSELKKEFGAIEWKIQTTLLEMHEEKQLIEKVKKLERQLKIHVEMNKRTEKISELKRKLATLKANANATHNKLTNLAEKSQTIHQKIIVNINQLKNNKEKADSAHSLYLIVKKERAQLYKRTTELIDKRKNLQSNIRKEEEKQKKEIERALKEKLQSEAREKLQLGKKLSWNEFKLLTENDSRENQKHNKA